MAKLRSRRSRTKSKQGDSQDSMETDEAPVSNAEQGGNTTATAAESAVEEEPEIPDESKPPAYAKESAVEEEPEIPEESKPPAYAKDDPPNRNQSEDYHPGEVQPNNAPNSDSEAEQFSANVVFQCGKCRVVVSDSIAGFEGFLESKTIMLNGAVHVSIDEKLVMSDSGYDVGCVFQYIKCDNCGTSLGKVYSSTTRALDNRRAAYVFDTSALTSYQLGTCRTISGDPLSLKSEEQNPHTPAAQPTKNGHDQNTVPVEVFDALDAHVITLTEAVNKLNIAFEENRSAISKIRSGFEHAQSIILLWEERYRRLEACEQRLEACEQRLESSIRSIRTCDGRIVKVETALKPVRRPASPSAGPQTPQRLHARYMKVSPTIRKPAPSPARPARKVPSSPQRTTLRGGPSPARGPLRTMSSPSITPGAGLPQRRR